MLHAEKVAEVRRLLVEGKLSQRKIARAVGVSRGSVNVIASGRRLDYPDRGNLSDANLWLPDGPFVRCGGCGGKAQLPCVCCRDRQALAGARKQRSEIREQRAEDLELQLHPAERTRYQEILRAREAAADQENPADRAA